MRGTAKSDYELLQDEMRQLKRENAALRGLVETLREYAQSLAYEWAWKRDSSLANDREMQALDAAIDAARAALAKGSGS